MRFLNARSRGYITQGLEGLVREWGRGGEGWGVGGGESLLMIEKGCARWSV